MGQLRGIELTDAQREQIRAIHEGARDDGSRAKLGELQTQLQAAIFADTVDLQKVEALKSSIAQAEAAALAARIDVQTRVAQVLTPEQRAQARANAANRPQRGGDARGPRGRGRL
jgi:Spy/CpxP family protein refolding chaperone